MRTMNTAVLDVKCQLDILIGKKVYRADDFEALGKVISWHMMKMSKLTMDFNFQTWLRAKEKPLVVFDSKNNEYHLRFFVDESFNHLFFTNVKAGFSDACGIWRRACHPNSHEFATVIQDIQNFLQNFFGLNNSTS